MHVANYDQDALSWLGTFTNSTQQFIGSISPSVQWWEGRPSQVVLMARPLSMLMYEAVLVAAWHFSGACLIF